jgi:hypothetical protein|tara:strand:+ start:1811 stop:2050 length:240 start_codon:yes stop_codon:yes gene_type:complete
LDNIDADVIAELWDIFEAKIPKEKPEVASKFVNFLIEQGVAEETLRQTQKEHDDDVLFNAINEVLDDYIDDEEDEDNDE